MLFLPHVFSDGALYQHDSNLDIHGRTEPETQIHAFLILDSDNTVISDNTALSGSNGKFTVTLRTPKASFAEYTIKVCTECESINISNIMFGELWLASGQSNMSFPNRLMPDMKDLFEIIREKNIRIYAQSALSNIPHDGEFPFEPVDSTDGIWISADNIHAIAEVSAVATAAVNYVYDYLNTPEASDMPVGFLNISVGATHMSTWLPKSVILENAYLHEHHAARNDLPLPERFNTYGGDNFKQPCALYNLKVECVSGVKTRGVFWYQGESNTHYSDSKRYYKEAMSAYHEYYSKLFKSESENSFPMISSQIYPYLYNENTCTMAPVNDALSEMPVQYPDKFMCASIYDLKPIWAYGLSNHPIHPANKYDVGNRLGELALTNCYGKKGIKTAVTYSSSRREKNKILVKFRTSGHNALYSGGSLTGFYICGKNNIYTEADVKIISNDTIELSNPYIDEPRHAAYQYSDMEMSGRLYCGGMPVAPFATDKKNPIHIMPKPWVHTDKDSVWVCNEISRECYDSFYRPTWLGENGSMICRDDIFRTSDTERALRIISVDRSDIIGAYVQSYPANRLDMHNYKGMTFNLTGSNKIKCEVKFECVISDDETRILTFKANDIGQISNDSRSCSVLFDVPECNVKRMVFRFDCSESPIKAINIDNIKLIVK